MNLKIILIKHYALSKGLIYTLEKKDFIIALIGISGGILSIFGGFLLSISFSLRNKKREIEFKMQLLYLKIIKEKEKLPNELIKKISDFENESHKFSKYLEGGSNYKDSLYTSMLDFSKLKKSNIKNKRLINKIKKSPGHLEYSKNFEAFAKWTDLNLKSKNIDDYKKIYEIFSKYKTFESYSESILQNFSDTFSENEKDIYHNYIKNTKSNREELWNISKLLPNLKFGMIYLIGVLYLMLIGTIGILIPFIDDKLTKSEVQFLMTAVCILTFVYILLVFLNSYTSSNPKKIRPEIKKYYY